jgi:hypothetical protein
MPRPEAATVKATLNTCILHMFSDRKSEPSSDLLAPNQSLA